MKNNSLIIPSVVSVYTVFLSTILLFGVNKNVFSQNILNNQLDLLDENFQEPIKTSEILGYLNWKELESECKYQKNCSASNHKIDSLTFYNYRDKEFKNLIKIISYRGFIIEYLIKSENTSNSFETDYFNKKLWLSYSKIMLPDISDSLRISPSENKDILKDYYTLLGLNIQKEYGWICEYSAAGMPPPQREASITFIKYQRDDLLLKLLDAPEVVTQLYALDALIYIDHLQKVKTQELETDLKSMHPDGLPESWMLTLKEDQRQRKERFELIKEKIEKLKKGNPTVLTCGNSGSYKIYEEDAQSVLLQNDKNGIVEQYENLKSFGYME